MGQSGKSGDFRWRHAETKLVDGRFLKFLKARKNKTPFGITSITKEFIESEKKGVLFSEISVAHTQKMVQRFVAADKIKKESKGVYSFV